MGAFPISVRLTLWYSAVLLLGLTLFGGAMWFALANRLVAEVDERLAQRVQGLQTVLEVESEITDSEALRKELAEFAREVPEGSLIQLRDSSGRRILPLADGPPFFTDIRSDHPVRRTTKFQNRSFRLLTTRFEFAGKTYDVLVGSSLDEVSAVMRDFRTLLLWTIPAVLLVACLGGGWISRRALAPVDQITAVARSITVQNLSHRLPVPRTNDELQRMSEAWNQVLERLDGAVQRIRQFTADASHELRTPVAVIRTAAELALLRDRSPQEYRTALRDIQAEAERVTNLTESLLSLARADASGGELPLSPADMNDIAGDVVRSSLPIADVKGITLSVRIAADAPRVCVNAPAIRRLLVALVDNALKHTATGGRVTVATACAEGGLLLSVEDTGEGIDPLALPHIFERFFRADTARSSGAGAGLGLSIAQAIAEAHGSEIEVESAVGSGSRFELLLRS